jgi:hypothetical protein
MNGRCLSTEGPRRRENRGRNVLVALIDVDRDLAVERFRQMPHDEQIALVRSAPQSSRYDVLTLADDATGLVRALQVPELHALVRHEEIERVGSLVACTTPEQMRGIMDFACWSGDELDGVATESWLRWLIELPDSEFALRVEALDPALMAGAIGPSMELAGDGPEPVTIYATHVHATPGGIAFADGFVEQFVVRLFEMCREVFDDLVDRIFRDGWTLEPGTKAGLADQIGEAAHERSVRLRTLKVRDTYGSRAQLLRPFEIRPARRGRPRATNLPEIISPRSPLDEALDWLPTGNASDAWVLETEQLTLDVVMARGQDPTDAQTVAEAAGYVHAALSVALDTLSGGSAPMAAIYAATWACVDLFRAGNTLIERTRAKVSAVDLERAMSGPQSVWLEAAIADGDRLLVHDAREGLRRLPNRLADLLRIDDALARVRKL